MCLTQRQYSANTYLTHFLWEFKILQKQMTEIMDDLEEEVAEKKYTDGEYLAMSKNIKNEYDTFVMFEKYFTALKARMNSYMKSATDKTPITKVIGMCVEFEKAGIRGPEPRPRGPTPWGDQSPVAEAGWMDQHDQFSDFAMRTNGNRLMRGATEDTGLSFLEEDGEDVTDSWQAAIERIEYGIEMKLNNTQMYADRGGSGYNPLTLINLIGTGEESNLAKGWMTAEWGKTPEAGAAGSSWENPELRS